METIKRFDEKLEGMFANEGLKDLIGPFELSNGQIIAISECEKGYVIFVDVPKRGGYMDAAFIPSGLSKEEIADSIKNGDIDVENIDFPFLYSFTKTVDQCRKEYYDLVDQIADSVIKAEEFIKTEKDNEVKEAKEANIQHEEKNEEPASKDELANAKDKNIWKGSRYNPSLTREQIVDLIHDYVNDKYNFEYWFDIYMIYRTKWSQIVIKLIQSPVPAFTDPNRTYISTWKFYEENEKELQKEMLDIMNDVYEYAASFRYEKTINEDDPCEFKTNFTLELKIGDKDRPYRCRE